MTHFFLPGASGSASFWTPVAAHLPPSEEHHFFAWPGLGNEAHQQNYQSIDDLIDLVLANLKQPTALIAQSMGGYIALHVALKRPDLISHLVLTAASAGLEMNELGAINWRANYQNNFPNSASFIMEPTEDLTTRLSQITAPCLLLWGGNDPISPVEVGERLESHLPNARLVVFEDGDHDLAVHYAKDVAFLIEEHLAARQFTR